MEYEIEKDVPIPSHQSRVWPFADMEVGDSFVIKNETAGNCAANAAYQYGVRYGQKFKRRKVSGGIRIWRVS